MIKVAYALAFVLGGFCEPRVAGAMPLTLKDAIETAKVKSPALTVAAAEEKLFSAKADAALVPASPVFGLGFGDLAAPPGESGLRTYQISQSFGFPGKAHTEASAYRLDAESSSFTLKEKEQELVSAVRNAFYTLWLAQRRLSLNEERKKKFEDVLRVAKRRFVKNTTTEVEFLETNLALQGVENERLDFLAHEKTDQARLNILLGEESERPIELAEPAGLRHLPTLNRKSLRDALLNASPSVLAGQKKVAAFEGRLSLARKSWLPDFTLSAGTNSLGGNAATIELTFPLWVWMKDRPNVTAAEQEMLAASAAVEAQRRELLNAFDQHLNQVESLEKKVENYQDHLIPTAKRASDVAFANYKFGKIDFSTLKSATNSSIDTKLEYEALRKDLLSEEAALESLIGKDLK